MSQVASSETRKLGDSEFSFAVELGHLARKYLSLRIPDILCVIW